MYIWWRRAGRGRRGRGVAERGAEELGPACGARGRLVRDIESEPASPSPSPPATLFRSPRRARPRAQRRRHARHAVERARAHALDALAALLREQRGVDDLFDPELIARRQDAAPCPSTVAPIGRCATTGAPRCSDARSGSAPPQCVLRKTSAATAAAAPTAAPWSSGGAAATTAAPASAASSSAPSAASGSNEDEVTVGRVALDDVAVDVQLRRRREPDPQRHVGFRAHARARGERDRGERPGGGRTLGERTPGAQLRCPCRLTATPARRRRVAGRGQTAAGRATPPRPTRRGVRRAARASR